MGSPGRTPNPQLTADFQKLQTDTNTIVAKSQVIVAETTALRADFQAINQAATTAASQTAIQTLQTDVKSVQGTVPTDTQKAQLIADFTAVVNSRGVTDQTLIDKTVSDAEAIVASSNITAADLATIAADQTAIQTDLGSTNSHGFPVGLGGDAGLPSLGGLLSRGIGGMGDHMGMGGLFGGPRWGGGR